MAEVTTMRVTVAGLDKLQQAFESGPGTVRKHLKQGWRQGTLIVEREAKQRIAQRTRATARTIFSEVRVEGGVVVGRVGSSSKVADWIENGTGQYHVPDARQPWTVVPKNRKALAIPAKSGGAAAWATQNLPGGGYQRAVNAKGQALFRTPKGGSSNQAKNAQSVMFRKKVVIKGMKSRPFLMPSWEAKKPEFLIGVRQALDAALAEIAHGGGSA